MTLSIDDSGRDIGCSGLVMQGYAVVEHWYDWIADIVDCLAHA